jgi:predicted ATPase/DNA-binding XRE family transcriptional regulator
MPAQGVAGLAPARTVMEMRDVRELSEIGALLRRYRVQAGLTQELLAERAGLGTRTIQGFECGERRPRRNTARQLAAALGLTDADREKLEATLQAIPRPRPPVYRVDRIEERASDAPCRDLPAALDGFVGREAEVADVKRQLASARLVTLTGAPGVGKTRLAREVGAELIDSFPGRVRFIPLAAIRNPDRVVATVAQAVGVNGSGRLPLVDHLAEHLRDRRVLLILDNFEQVVAAAPLVARLLQACPGLKALVTSRTRLHLRGEREVVVPPLALPRQGDPIAAVRDAEAVRLFVTRAREVRPDLVVDGENLAAIAAICRQLDGLPLSIELAAAWCRVLAPPAVLKRLTRRLALLTGGSADLPPRQRTLRAAIGWSYDLLNAAERRLFRWLAVFVGGFNLEAAEALGATLETLTGLLDKSLVQLERRAANGLEVELRFGMLETIHDYARERLDEGGDAETARRDHATYFLAFAEAANAGARGEKETIWLDRFERDHANLRAALRFFLDTADVRRALGLSRIMQRLWSMRCYVEEARALIVELLDLATSTGSDADRAQVLRTAGRIEYVQSDLAPARAKLEESLLLARRADDRVGIAEALALLGLVVQSQGDYARAGALSSESLEIFRELGDASAVGAQLDRVGQAAFYQGDVRAARALLEESLAVRRKLNDPIYLSWAVLILGQLDHADGDYARARLRYEESLATWREAGYRYGIGEALARLGDLAIDAGDLTIARARLSECLDLSRALGYWEYAAHALESLAGLASARNEPRRAFVLAGAAAALREKTGALCPPDIGARLARRLGPARSLLGQEVAVAWAEGHALEPEQAIAYALE